MDAESLENPFLKPSVLQSDLKGDDVREWGMVPNYGNKRVYLEGEEKYRFPGRRQDVGGQREAGSSKRAT